jgi:hypothetical protein
MVQIGTGGKGADSAREWVTGLGVLCISREDIGSEQGSHSAEKSQLRFRHPVWGSWSILWTGPKSEHAGLIATAHFGQESRGGRPSALIPKRSVIEITG